MNKGSLVFFAAILAMATGCGSPVSFKGAATAASENQPFSTNPIDVADNIPACEIDIPQVKLQGNLNAFEFAGGAGITFGYNANGIDPGLGGSADIMVQWAQMDLSMTATDPMLSTVLASTDVNANQTKMNIGLSIDFGLWSVSPSYRSSTPLATMTSGGLKTSLGAIKTQTDKIAWVGRVIEHLDANTLVINGGSAAGISVGDQFNIHNVTHFWSDPTQPCNSTYYGSTHDDVNPEETITIVSVSNSLAVGTVNGGAGVHIRQGAEVSVNTLVAAAKGAPARYLKKEAILGQITALPIQLPGGGTFDFEGDLNSQAVNVVQSSGAYVFKTN